MKRFKHGDKVTCYIDGVYIDDAMIGINKYGVKCLCNNKKGYYMSPEDFFGDYERVWKLGDDFTDEDVTDLKLVDTRTEITWDNLQEGDVIKYNDEFVRFVLGICGRLIFTSYVDDKDTYSVAYTKEQFIREGYTIKQPTQSQPIPDETQKAIEHLQANGYKVTKE